MNNLKAKAGSIRTGRELGKKDAGHQFSWLPCENCGEARWVGIRNGKPRTKLCQNCGTQRYIAEIGLETRFPKGRTHPNYGKHLSPEARRKLSEAHKGKVVSAETRLKLRLANLGKKQSSETIEKKTQSMEARPHKERTLTMGYIMVYCPKHPRANKAKRVPEHRLVMEKFLGRFLGAKEIVHHENENITDNRIENLRLFPNIEEHLKYHREGKQELWQTTIA